MSKKTMGEIARSAWMNADDTADHWAITADAIIDECIKVVQADDTGMMMQDFGMQHGLTMTERRAVPMLEFSRTGNDVDG